MVRGGSSPLGRIKKDLLSGAGSVNDGGGANPISGYTVIEADDIETAMELVKRGPIVEGGRTVEIAETTTALWGRSPPSMVQLAATREVKLRSRQLDTTPTSAQASQSPRRVP